MSVEQVEPKSPEEILEYQENRLVNRKDVIKWINDRLCETMPFSQGAVILTIPTSQTGFINQLAKDYRNKGWEIQTEVVDGFVRWTVSPIFNCF